MIEAKQANELRRISSKRQQRLSELEELADKQQKVWEEAGILELRCQRERVAEEERNNWKQISAVPDSPSKAAAVLLLYASFDLNSSLKNPSIRLETNAGALRALGPALRGETAASVDELFADEERLNASLSFFSWPLKTIQAIERESISLRGTALSLQGFRV